MPTIYLHPHCATYALSPLLMLTHLQTSHAASTARTLALHGHRGLNQHLLKHTLHWTPRACTPVFPCTDCSVLFYTAIEAHMHLLSAPEHTAHVAAVRRSEGEEGVAGMVRSAWLEPTDVVRETQIAPVAPAAGIPAPLEQPQGPVNLTLTVERYTKRPHYPARVKMAVTLPRCTDTVAVLAGCLEEAWVAKGGGAGKVNWARMVRAVGVIVEGRGKLVNTDDGVKEWVMGAVELQVGRMCGRATGV